VGPNVTKMFGDCVANKTAGALSNSTSIAYLGDITWEDLYTDDMQA